MFINKIIAELQARLTGNDWFANKIDQSKECHNTLIVYVNRMNYSIFKHVPDEYYGFHIVVHFIGSIQDKYQVKDPKNFAYKIFDHTINLQIN